MTRRTHHIVPNATQKFLLQYISEGEKKYGLHATEDPEGKQMLGDYIREMFAEQARLSAESANERFIG